MPTQPNARVSAPKAIGAAITDVTMQSTAGTPQANVLVTFGQIFAPGDLPAVGAAVELMAADNSVVACQMDARVNHDDGSVRHAVLSAVIPTLAASQSITYGIVRKSAGAAPAPAVPSDFPGLDSVVTFTQGGTVYTASLAPLLAAGFIPWLAGNVVSEWAVSVSPKTEAGAEHPNLHVRFCVRGYKGQNKARVDIVIENNWAYAAAPKNETYDVVITVGGANVYQQNALVHYHHARWRKVFWWNAAEPAVHIKHNTAYLIGSRALPNYDQSLVIEPKAFDGFKANMAANNDVMGSGCAQRYMPGVGGRSDMGILPGWTAAYVLSMHKVGKDITLRQGEQSGSWPIHLRDIKTGRVLSMNDYPYYGGSDAVNPVTEICKLVVA